jgi:hypothetical protein
MFLFFSSAGMSVVYLNIQISGKLLSNQYDTFDLREPSREQFLNSLRGIHASIQGFDFHVNVASHLATTTSKNGLHPPTTHVVDVRLRERAEIVTVILRYRTDNKGRV